MVLLLVALFLDPESLSKEICFRAILESSREGAHQMVSKVGAWICCFMLDTSLRQTPNAKRQTQNSNSRPRRSHRKFFKKDLSLLRRWTVSYVEHVRWWCWIPDSYFSPGGKTHSLFVGDLHCISKSSLNLTKYLTTFVYRKRSWVSLI
jgi:hypothetical protein